MAVVQAQSSDTKCLLGGKAGVETLKLKHKQNIDDILGSNDNPQKSDTSNNSIIGTQVVKDNNEIHV